jgi:ATP-dependent RNA helicase DOB1
MNSNDLFSFLDETLEGADSDHDEPMDIEMDAPAVNKRKVDIFLGPDEENVQVSLAAPKKQRISSPKLVVLDDFETEAKREVATSAGLTGVADTGSRLELKHQVCRLEKLGSDEICMNPLSGSTSSIGPSRLRLHPNL